MSNSGQVGPSSPLHSVSVAGVVVRGDGRVLVVRRADNGRWEAPGGVLELGEGVEDGVVREVFEETGVRVGVERLTGVYKNLARGVVALVFRCRVEGGQPRPTDEATAVAWLTPEEVTARMEEVYAVRVLDALGEELAPRVRAHDGRRVVSAGGAG
ncbi:8-oxo-dGTP diphosphatase [Kitasatospora sp. MAA4]|uniref:NUDIX hydrolase n=1 Tax=Kitasatospora sp. MAA4 TaxID=3035093 RepID=UPI002474AF3D|nr:NUDIX domain-containing protein [Kitasatospora sp. MAA4]MDH6137693.1 8-oxo-dGTP diphosphatase [Kitasatospora sp. MAA4]